MDVRLLCCVFFLAVIYEKVESQRCPDNAFGATRCYRCHCKQRAPCDKVTGECPSGCGSGYFGPICQMENIARRLRTSQSSTKGDYRSHLAVEGNIRQKDIESDPHCIWTDPEATDNPWWKVELRRKQDVWRMRLFANKDDMAAIKGFEVYVSDGPNSTLCYKDMTDQEQKIYDIKCSNDEAIPGTSVEVKLPEARALRFCELEIYNCAYGWYGRECNKECNARNCATEREECGLDGICQSGCKEGWYGDTCEEKCVDGCRKCDQKTGGCVECTGGLYNAVNNCDKKCNDRHCTTLRPTCFDDGFCPECNDNWYGVDCSKRCPGGCSKCSKEDGGCRSCSKGHYGDECEKSCDDADRHCREPTDCSHEGHCLLGCQEGWYGHNCSMACPENCVACDQERGKCDKCKPGTYYPGIGCSRTCESRHCVKSDAECPVYGHCRNCADGWFGHDCTRACPDECGSCDQRYGNCVTCSLGVYGDNCDKFCNDTMRECAEGPLHCNKDGDCPGNCTDGWYGNNCTMQCEMCKTCKKEDGMCLQCADTDKYGELCSDDCSNRHCASDEEPCPATGYCSSCDDGWFGNDCTKECTDGCAACNQITGVCERCGDGFHGMNCELECEACKTCNKIDGSCLSCIDDNKYGPTCEGDCSDRHCYNETDVCPFDGFCASCADEWYGFACNQPCPDGCLMCDKTTGVCAKCKNGFYGADCKQECESCESCHRADGRCLTCKNSDHYGSDCSKSCSARKCLPNEEDDVCPIDGYCALCVDGWHGADCQIACAAHCIMCDKLTDFCEECENGFYGNMCSMECNSCETCHKDNGNCLTCPEGKYGPWCGEECNTRNCLEDEECIINNATCRTGCKDGFFGPYCRLPCSGIHLNCARCEQGVCTACKEGYYGFNCEFECPEGCADCAGDDQLNMECTACYAGKYGYNCEMECSASCLGLTCNVDDGICSDGCIPGMYGLNCKEMCSSTCDTNEDGELLCNVTDGYCSNGCVRATYGNHCENNCSATCAGEMRCSRDNGVCIKGCVNGLYGEQCDKNCTEECESGVCDQFEGHCITIEAEETKGDGDGAGSIHLLGDSKYLFLLAILGILTQMAS